MEWLGALCGRGAKDVREGEGDMLVSETTPIGEQKAITARKEVCKHAGKFSQVPVIDSKALRKLMDEHRAVVVDVRTKDEQDVSMIPGAITKSEFESAGGVSNYHNQVIVPYCTIGYRSGEYGTALKDQHPDCDVRNGEGIILWTHSFPQEELAKGPGRSGGTRTVHTYGKAWNWAHPSFSTVQFSTLGTVTNFIPHLFNRKPKQ